MVARTGTAVRVRLVLQSTCNGTTAVHVLMHVCVHSSTYAVVRMAPAAGVRYDLLTTQQAGQTDWGPLSNRWTGNVHFSPFSIFWSSSTQRIPRPAHQACHNLDQNTSRKAGADLDHCSFLGSVHTGAKPKITVFRYKQILPVLLPAVPERTLL